MYLSNRKKKEKIFCIGLNKSGTTTVEKVLKDFGFSLGHQPTAERLFFDYADRNFNPIIKYCHSAEAFQDIPFSLPGLYVHLDQVFPKAKFILTVRDTDEQWYHSITKFHSKKFADGVRIPTYDDLKRAFYREENFVYDSYKRLYGVDVPSYDKERLCGIYNNHIEAARYYFKDKSNFIEINVSNDNDYLRLAKFLNKKPNGEGFPWLNKT